MDAYTHLLTIAIPTWNRAEYLEKGLLQLQKEVGTINEASIEIIVSDNNSTDDTQKIIENIQNLGLKINYIKNRENIGWARNFIQCYEKSNGKYVLLMGDDDLFYDGGLKIIYENILHSDYGAVCIKPYGFNIDYIAENPGLRGSAIAYDSSNVFLIDTFAYSTLTSAVIVNRSYLKKINPKKYLDSDLAAFHLFLKAALSADKNLFIKHYLIAAKRNNSSSYDFSEVFGCQLWRIYEDHINYGLEKRTLDLIKFRFIFSYYPYYLLKMRIEENLNLKLTLNNFDNIFYKKISYKIYLRPILVLPRFFAIVFGIFMTIIGRIYNKELGFGINYFINKLKLKFPSKIMME